MADDKKISETNGEPTGSMKRYRTILDPVAHYVLASPGAEPKLLAFINSVFADKNEPAVERVTILNPFNPKEFPSEKQVVVDILAEDENKRKFNIEFQVWDHKFFIERGLYYWARAYSRQLAEGKKYEGLYPVVSIFLTDFQNPTKLGGLYERQSGKIHQSFKIRSDETPEIVLTEHLNLHFVQLPKTINAESLAEVHPKLAHWLTYFGYPVKTTEADMENAAKNDPAIEAALNAYQTFHQDPELRSVAENSERFKLDAEAYGDAREARGKAEGRMELLLRILTKRLGPLPEELTAKISGLTDLAEIERLADVALDVPTLDEFMKQLR